MKGTSIFLAMILGIGGVIYHQIALENEYHKGKNEGLASLHQKTEQSYKEGRGDASAEWREQLAAREAEVREEMGKACEDLIEEAKQQTRATTEARIKHLSETEKQALRDSFEQEITAMYEHFDSIMRDSLLAVTSLLKEELAGMIKETKEEEYQKRKEESKIHVRPDWYLDSNSRLELLRSTTRIKFMPLLSWIGAIFIALLILHGILGRKRGGILRTK